LDLRDTNFSDVGILKLQVNSLRSLLLNGRFITDVTANALSKANPPLVLLDISRTSISDNGVSAIAQRLRLLEYLRIGDGCPAPISTREVGFDTPLTGRCLDNLHLLICLDALHLNGVFIDTHGLTKLPPSLKLLYLRDCGGSFIEPTALSSLQQLRELNIACSSFSDAALVNLLAGISHLKSLNISRCLQLSCIDIEDMVTLTDLSMLRIDYMPQVSSRGFSLLFSKMPGLTSVNAKHATRFSNSNIAALLEGERRPMRMYLRGCNRVTDRGMAFLAAECSEDNTIQDLDVAGSSLTAASIVHFAKMGNLRKLNVTGTLITCPDAMLAAIPHMHSPRAGVFRC
jgi:hypothetical protein